MKLLKSITEKDFGREETTEQWASYRLRTAARAVLFDESSRIALMHVVNHHYYKLPGGGIDEGEDIMTALKRELTEEVGASSIEVTSEIGQIDEYRDEWQVKSEHYGFIATLTGPLAEPARTQKELDHGYQTVWANNIDEAIALVESGETMEYGQAFERMRELTFLQEVKRLL